MSLYNQNQLTFFGCTFTGKGGGHKPVDHTLVFMQILQRFSNLYDDVSAQIFTKISQTNDLVEEFAARTQFEDDVIILLRFGKVDEPDDIGVV